jgi:Flp pilus assembly protein TadD
MDLYGLTVLLCLILLLCGCSGLKSKENPSLQEEMKGQQGEEPLWDTEKPEPNHLALARDLVQKGHYDAALVELEKAGPSPEGNPEIQYLLGICYRERGDFERAVNAFTQALKYDPSYAPAHNGLGLTRVRHGDPETAVIDFTRAVHLDPAQPDFQNNLGHVYMETNQLDLAEAHFKMSLALDPGYRLAENNLAVCRFLKGKEDAALSLLLKHNPRQVVYQQLSEVYRARGDEDRARELAERALLPDVDDKKTPLPTAPSMIGGQPVDTPKESNHRNMIVTGMIESTTAQQTEEVVGTTEAAFERDHNEGKRFSVQVGACLKGSNAKAMIDELIDRNYQPYIFQFHGKDNRHWYLVRIGDFADLEAAEAAAAAYRKSENAEALVTRYDSPKVVPRKDL